MRRRAAVRRARRAARERGRASAPSTATTRPSAPRHREGERRAAARPRVIETTAAPTSLLLRASHSASSSTGPRSTTLDQARVVDRGRERRRQVARSARGAGSRRRPVHRPGRPLPEPPSGSRLELRPGHLPERRATARRPAPPRCSGPDRPAGAPARRAVRDRRRPGRSAFAQPRAVRPGPPRRASPAIAAAARSGSGTRTRGTAG